MSPFSLKLAMASTLLSMSAAGVCQVQQAAWPKSIYTYSGTVINLYSPQILSFSGDTVRYRSVISVQAAPGADQVFGAVWVTAKVVADAADRQLAVNSVQVDRLRIPQDTDRVDNDILSFEISVGTPRVLKSMSVDEVRKSLQLLKQEKALAEDTAVASPTVYFATKQTALVLIDGEPRFQRNERWGLDVVMNSRNLIVHGVDGKFYLFGGSRWYVADSATGPYVADKHKESRELSKVTIDLFKAARKDNVYIDYDAAEVSTIIVSTTPAVLVQCTGNPSIKAIAGTSLSYVTNSDNLIFYDASVQVYYVKAGNRWFRTLSLKKDPQWEPIERTDLPADALLTLHAWASGEQTPPQMEDQMSAQSVAWVRTDAREKMILDDQVPQTARVARGITTHVDYDGPPRFKPIEGTGLEYATNTCSIVFKYNGVYFALDNGVWFIAESPQGFWKVSDFRPSDVELIPKRYRVYRAKFVYIYQATPEYVYEGYLPGYDDNPADDCALAATYDDDWTDVAWCYDLDFVFGWGLGWYNGYYRFDRLNSYYGWMVYEGSQAGWHGKAYGPWAKNGGISKQSGGSPGGGSPGGGSPGGGGGPRGGYAGGILPRGGMTPVQGGSYTGRTYTGGNYTGGGARGVYKGGSGLHISYSAGAPLRIYSGGAGNAGGTRVNAGGGSVGGAHVNVGGANAGGVNVGHVTIGGGSAGVGAVHVSTGGGSGGGVSAPAGGHH